MVEREKTIAYQKFLYNTEIGLKVIEDKINVFPDILYLLRGKFTKDSLITVSEWESNFASLNLMNGYKGLVGVGYIVITDNQKIAQYKNYFKKHYEPYKIANEDFEIIGKSLDPKFTSILVYIYPFDTNSHRLGYNSFSSEERYKSILTSIEKGYPISTKILNLFGDEKEEKNSIIIYLPLYKFANGSLEKSVENTFGVLSMGLNLDEFFGNIFLDFNINKINLNIYDVTESLELTQENLIFKKNDNIGNSVIKAQYDLNFGGRQWLVEFIAPSDQNLDYEKLFFIFLSLINILLIWNFVIINKYKQTIIVKA